ncbi:hypothetical protein Mal15_57990 [Stieleria maiorica]|uniref:Uncharacterized protein n=1 Tax=Stieleria maiorica TaxID=2795974 RepID=A0A5B9MMU5_9BACT|nr:hypothetical protein Mal15_57990 [Stieleria maiorica]
MGVVSGGNPGATLAGRRNRFDRAGGDKKWGDASAKFRASGNGWRIYRHRKRWSVGKPSNRRFPKQVVSIVGRPSDGRFCGTLAALGRPTSTSECAENADFAGILVPEPPGRAGGGLSHSSVRTVMIGRVVPRKMAALTVEHAFICGFFRSNYTRLSFLDRPPGRGATCHFALFFGRFFEPEIARPTTRLSTPPAGLPHQASARRTQQRPHEGLVYDFA